MELSQSDMNNRNQCPMCRTVLIEGAGPPARTVGTIAGQGSLRRRNTIDLGRQIQREHRLCFTAACNALARGQHQVYCQEFWWPPLPSPPVAALYTHGIPSVPCIPRNIFPNLSHDRIGSIQAGHPQLQRPSFHQSERYWRLGVTLDGSRELNPPESSMRTSDRSTWRQQVTEHWQEQQQSYTPPNMTRPTIMNGDEYLASFIQQGYETILERSSQIASQQDRRSSVASDNTSRWSHARPSRQAVELADVIEEDMDARQALRRAERNRNRGRG